MKTKSLLIVLLSITLFQFWACDEEKPKVQQPKPVAKTTPETDKTANKLAADKKELLSSLQAQKNGWKATLHPAKEGVGGFNLLLKFTSDTELSIASDQSKDASKPSAGKYELKAESILTLIFEKGSLLDGLLVADPKQVADGTERQFSFKEKTKDKDEYIFINNKSKQEIFLTKATADDWKNIDQLFENEALISKLKTLAVTVGKVETLYKVAFDSKARTITTIITENKEEKKATYGLTYTPTGFNLNPGLPVNKQKLTDFVLEPTKKDSYIAKGANNVKAVLKK